MPLPFVCIIARRNDAAIFLVSDEVPLLRGGRGVLTIVKFRLKIEMSPAVDMTTISIISKNKKPGTSVPGLSILILCTQYLILII